MSDFVTVQRGDAPLIVAFPHGGTDLAGLDDGFVSPWLARKDADWHISELYGFAHALGATTVATAISRSIIDVNRDPSGASLYPGLVTTGLCPTETFDGEPLYAGTPPDAAEITRRHDTYFVPYHGALAAEITRLRALHPHIVLYDAHSIRSHVPRLFAGKLPIFNIGTDSGRTAAPRLEAAFAYICATSGRSHVFNGRFRGGWTTRQYGAPEKGVHAIQMELAMRAYCTEPDVPSPASWPPRLHADPEVSPDLRDFIEAAIAFARKLS